MIEELKEHIYGYSPEGKPELVGPPTSEELIDKINEIIRYINIDSLESEKPMNLEEEISRTYHDGSVTDTSDLDHVSYENIARHFYELGCRRTAEKYDEIEYNRQRAEESPLPEDTVLFNKGVEEGKRLMMEEAVEGEVVKDINNKLAVTAKNVNLDKFKFGDKVRVIVLPKEDKK